LKKQLEEGNIAKMRRLQEELTGTQEQLSQVGAYVQELQKRMQAQGKTVESANRFVAEIRRLNAFISDLQNEYTAKINQANAINQAQANKNAELETDAKQMALMLAAETPLVEQALYSQEERKNPKK
jgi:molybdopterin converting factor small subunit